MLWRQFPHSIALKRGIKDGSFAQLLSNTSTSTDIRDKQVNTVDARGYMYIPTRTLDVEFLILECSTVDISITVSGKSGLCFNLIETELETFLKISQRVSRVNSSAACRPLCSTGGVASHDDTQSSARTSYTSVTALHHPNVLDLVGTTNLLAQEST